MMDEWMNGRVDLEERMVDVFKRLVDCLMWFDKFVNIAPDFSFFEKDMPILIYFEPIFSKNKKKLILGFSNFENYYCFAKKCPLIVF